MPKMALPLFLDSLSISGATKNTWERVVEEGYVTVGDIAALKPAILAEITTEGGNRIGLLRATKILTSLQSDRVRPLLARADRWLQTTSATQLVTTATTALARPVTGLKVCVTGTGPAPREELQARLKAAGAVIQSAVSSTTDLLISSEGMDKGKAKKAAALGVAVATYAEVFG